MMVERKRNSGFTLVEALAASVILALVVATVSGLSGKSIAQARKSSHYQQAWQMLDRQMTMISNMGVEDFLIQGVTSGELPAPGGAETTYYWQAEMTDLDMDDLYDLTVMISWGNKSITASTMLYKE